jgi:hypothetical protein
MTKSRVKYTVLPTSSRNSRSCGGNQYGGFKVIKKHIDSGVQRDCAGCIVPGNPDEMCYDTLYHYLVLSGIPEPFQAKDHPLVWKVINKALSVSVGMS